MRSSAITRSCRCAARWKLSSAPSSATTASRACATSMPHAIWRPTCWLAWRSISNGALLSRHNSPCILALPARQPLSPSNHVASNVGGRQGTQAVAKASKNTLPCKGLHGEERAQARVSNHGRLAPLSPVAHPSRRAAFGRAPQDEDEGVDGRFVVNNNESTGALPPWRLAPWQRALLQMKRAAPR